MIRACVLRRLLGYSLRGNHHKLSYSKNCLPTFRNAGNQQLISHMNRKLSAHIFPTILWFQQNSSHNLIRFDWFPSLDAGRYDNGVSQFLHESCCIWCTKFRNHVWWFCCMIMLDYLSKSMISLQLCLCGSGSSLYPEKVFHEMGCGGVYGIGEFLASIVVQSWFVASILSIDEFPCPGRTLCRQLR